MPAHETFVILSILMTSSLNWTGHGAVGMTNKFCGHKFLRSQIREMNRLPRVLLNEIDQFAHGDRKHWKMKYDQVLYDLNRELDRSQDHWYGEGRAKAGSRVLQILGCVKCYGGYWSKRLTEFRSFCRDNDVCYYADSRHEFVELNTLYLIKFH